MRTIILLIFGLLSMVCQAQMSSGRSYFVNSTSVASSDSEISVNAKGDTILISKYSGTNPELNSQQNLERKYLGTPYFRNKWFTGQTKLRGGIPNTGIMAFNVVKNVVHFAPDQETIATDIRPDVFTMDGLEFYNLDDVYEGASKFYYNYVVKGEPILLRQHHGTFVSTKDPIANAYGNAKTREYDGKFLKEENYYFVIQNQLVLVNRKKSFFKSMGPYTSEAQRIVKREKLNLKQPADIIKLAQLLQ